MVGGCDYTGRSVFHGKWSELDVEIFLFVLQFLDFALDPRDLIAQFFPALQDIFIVLTQSRPTDIIDLTPGP